MLENNQELFVETASILTYRTYFVRLLGTSTDNGDEVKIESNTSFNSEIFSNECILFHSELVVEFGVE